MGSSTPYVIRSLLFSLSIRYTSTYLQVKAGMLNSMQAVVIHQAGPPNTLKLETRPIPEPINGQVLIKVMAAGLNRSEMFTRQGKEDCI